MSASTLCECVQSLHARLRTCPLTLWRLCALVLLLTQASQPASAEPACKIGRWAELPVTMSGTSPIVHALINGKDAAFIADSGAYFNTLTPAAAAEFTLPLKMAPMGFAVTGVGGDQTPSLATVKEFTLFGVTFPNVLFVVFGNDLGSTAGLLGQNLFRIADTEYDLANGAIRIMHPGAECKSVGLAYWTTSTYSQIDLERASQSKPHIIGYAYVNGTKIKVLFDTGAGISVLSLAAAKRVGITPTSKGVVPAGITEGVGKHYVRQWIVPLHSFKVGDEEIRDTKLYIADLGQLASGAEMLLGADFFLSHRIYVANSRDKLYFTYNGGPVFNVGYGAEAPQPKSESIVVASGQAVSSAAEPINAEAYSRRATASAARQNYASAVADMNRACDLAPNEPSYRYQRGMALWGNGQSDLALADFIEALKLKPDHVPSLLARAKMRVKSDVPAATADLEAADRALPKEAVEHLEIGNTYEEADVLPAALVQYSKWIDSHERTDVRMPDTLNSRCWTRALLGQELDAARADCNAAVTLAPKVAAYLDSRALVYLRLGKYDKSIADYDAALAIDPKSASTRYCRGIARIRQGHAADGQADISEAVAQVPKVGELYSRHGITP